MSFKATVLQVLVASPSDVQVERQIVHEVIQAWNAVHAQDMGIVLLPLAWETHSRPQLGDRPQALINSQVVAHADILVGVFWTKLGTPTGEASSGTVEEIERLREEGKPVLLYFSSVPVAPDSVDANQYHQLKTFRDRVRDEGLFYAYDSVAQFRDALHSHLLREVRDSKDLGHHTEGDRENRATEDMQLSLLLSQYEQMVRRLQARWSAERDSDPLGVDEGKLVLREIGNRLLDLRSLPVVEAYPDIGKEMDRVLTDVSVLQKHQLYMDGGRSFRQFWQQGDTLIANLAEVTLKIRDQAAHSAEQ